MSLYRWNRRSRRNPKISGPRSVTNASPSQPAALTLAGCLVACSPVCITSGLDCDGILAYMHACISWIHSVRCKPSPSPSNSPILFFFFCPRVPLAPALARNWPRTLPDELTGLCTRPERDKKTCGRQTCVTQTLFKRQNKGIRSAEAGSASCIM